MSDLQFIYDYMLVSAAIFNKTQADMVYGEGNISARIMLVGEAPGAEETRLCRPFVGKAGKNLDEFLAVLCQKREDIYITNVVKFRPYRVSEKGRFSNRPPNRQEIECMLPHLFHEIEAVAPDIIVTLGNVALRAVLGQNGVKIGVCHAKAAAAAIRSHKFMLFPLYHPASIIYNRELKKIYQDDLLVLKDYVNFQK